MKVMNGQFPSLDQVANQYLDSKNNSQHVKRGNETKSFADILTEKQSAKQEVSGLKFSKHASSRLSERNIELSEAQKERLNAGMQAAGEKGINESLVMVDQLAFIVNVKNQTVITALAGNDGTANVFTNIDGAVIA